MQLNTLRKFLSFSLSWLSIFPVKSSTFSTTLFAERLIFLKSIVSRDIVYLLPPSYTARKWFILLKDFLLYNKSWLNFCFLFDFSFKSKYTALPLQIIFQVLYLILASPWEHQIYVYVNFVNMAQIELFCTRHHLTANEATVLSRTTLKSKRLPIFIEIYVRRLPIILSF